MTIMYKNKRVVATLQLCAFSLSSLFFGKLKNIYNAVDSCHPQSKGNPPMDFAAVRLL